MPSSEVRTFSFTQLERSAEFPGGPDDILSAAWAEAEHVREQARRDGEAEGRASGVAAAQAETTQALAALGTAARGLADLRTEVIETLETQAAELAVRIAEQILSAAVEVDPARVIDVTRGALRRLADRHRVTVLVNPDDLELLTEAGPALRQELGGIDHIDVQSDRRIDRGGAVVLTDYGELDTTLSAQLQTAREVILAALRPDADEADDAAPTDAG